MTQHAKSRLALGVAGMACAIGALAVEPVQAQQVAQVTGLEEIVVTARRREEALQSVPVAITAVTQELISDQKIVNYFGLQAFVPSLRNYNAASRRESDQISLRSAPGTTQYFAEAPVFITGTFYDLENIQIMKGPQGTSFGGNNSGGAIIIMPKKPDLDRLGGFGSFSIGNYQSREYEGALNIPLLAGKLALRLAGKRNEREGFTEDVGPIVPGTKYDARDDWSWRAGVMFKPYDWFDNYTVYSGYYRHTTSTGNKIFDFDPTGQLARTFGLARVTEVVAFQNAIGPRKAAMGFAQREVQQSSSVVNITQVQPIESLLVKNIFGWTKTNGVDNYDYDSSILPSNDRIDQPGWRSSSQTYSNEVNAQLNLLRDTLKLTAGWYWEGTRPADLTTGTKSITFGVPSPNITVGGLGNRSDTNAFYGLVNYDVGGVVESLEGLHVSGGLRRVHGRNYDQVSFGYNFNTGACMNLPGQFYPNCLRRLPDPPKSKLWNWSAGIDYQVTPQLLVYAITQRNNLVGTTVTNPVVDLPEFRFIRPQSFQNYEAGLKGDWDIAGMPTRTNLAYYRTKWKNLSRSVSAFNPCTNTTGGANRNAGTAFMEGAELEAQAQPTPDLSVQASYAWSAQRYLRYEAINIASLTFNCATGAVTYGTIPLTGLALAGSPRHKFTLNARYTMPFMPERLGKLSISGTYTRQGSYWQSSADTGPNQVAPGYYLANARVDWKNVAGYPLDLGLWVNNLTDNTFVQVPVGANWNTFGFSQRYWNEPRMYGLQITYRLGED